MKKKIDHAKAGGVSRFVAWFIFCAPSPVCEANVGRRHTEIPRLQPDGIFPFAFF